MANLKQSKKRVRQDIKKRAFNKRNLSIVRTNIKKFLKLINVGDYNSANKILPDVISKIAKGAAKGVIHKNKASRLKSRLYKKLK